MVDRPDANRNDVRIAVAVTLGSAGRSVLPTIRSVLRSPGVDPRVTVACDERDEDDLRRVLREASLDVAAVVCAGGRGDQRRAAVVAAIADASEPTQGVLVIDAGDLVDEYWLASAAMELTRHPAAIIRPEIVVTFGRRSGWWPQQADDASMLLPVAPAWGSTFVAGSATLAVTAQPIAQDTVADAAWQAQFAGAGREVRVTPGSAVFQRVWGDRAPWEPHPDLLPPLEFLRDPARSAVFGQLVTAPRSPGRRFVEGIVGARAARAAAAVVEPWARGVRGLRSAQRFPEWIIPSWRAANALEPLVPFPRPSVAEWYESVADSVVRSESVARAYWLLVGRMGGQLDYLYFAPWVRTGGGDAVLRRYVSAVRALDPTARVGLITTEPEDSPMLARVEDDVRVAELRDVLAAGVSRDDLVLHVVPTLIAQSAPRTLHAFNSTVAFDVVEQRGPELSQATRLFLTTFAIDRSADGERLSVLFLRRPGFLDPVAAVFVDSQHFVDRVVTELGYDRDKFVVQRSVVDAQPISREPVVREEDRPLRVLWAGRFDLPKRLDVLAAVATRARAVGAPVEFHYYGLEVMGTLGLQETLAALDAAGAVRHPPYRDFAELSSANFDAYVLTSEWEGIPLTVLEAMSAGIPVVAPLVGSVHEVLDARTGYPIEVFDDQDAYLDALEAIRRDPLDARRRSEAARARVRSEFAMEAFIAVLRSTPGYLLVG